MTEEDFAEDRPLLDAIAAMRTPPPPDLTAEFMRRARTQQPARRGTITIWIAGMAATFLISAAAGWLYQSRHVDLVPGMPATLLAQTRSVFAEERLQAIATIASTHRAGDGAEHAISDLLLADENTGVRLAATDALKGMAVRETLREALSKALQQETSTFVQLALISASDSLAPAERREVLEGLISRSGIDPLVLGDARNRLTQLPTGDSR